MRESLFVRRRSRARPWSARGVLFAAVACCSLALAGCGAAGTTSSTPPGGGGTSASSAGAVVTFCDSSNPSCTPASSFSVNSLRELGITVAWSNVPAGNHAQTLTLLLPNGNVYQAIESSFLVQSTPTGSSTVVRSIPVAGTFIPQRSLTGMWTVRVSLDDQPVTSQPLRLDP